MPGKNSFAGTICVSTVLHFKRAAQMHLAKQFLSCRRQIEIAAFGKTLLETMKFDQLQTCDSHPTLPFQKQLWLMQRMAPNAGVANISARLTWNGTLDLAAFQSATFDFVERHAYLKCALEVNDQGELVQVQHEAAPVDLTVIDLQHLPDEKRSDEISRLLSKATMIPLDLNSFPLIRCVVLRSSPELYDITFVFSHLTCDGLSMGILCREFLRAYEARLSGRIPVWNHDVPKRLTEQTEIAEQEVKRAKTNTASIPLPYCNPPDSNPNYIGARVSFELGPDESELLNLVSRQFEVSPFVTWLTLAQAIIFRYSQTREFSFDIVRSGRRSNQRRMVGPFFETVGIDLNVCENSSFESMLLDNQRCVNELNEFAPHQLPLSNSRSQILIDYQSSLPSANLKNGVAVFPSEWDNGAAVAELCIGIRRNKKQYSAHIKYDVELFNHATIARMISHLRQLLKSASSDPKTKIDRIGFLSPDELNINRVVNETGVRQSRTQFVDLQFLKHAEASPDSVAIVFRNLRLSYSQLKNRVLEIAHQLKNANITRGDRVGLLLNRDPDCVAAMLAVMHLGAAYVPIDPLTPKLHQQAIANRSELKCVLINGDNNCDLQLKTPLVHLDDGQKSKESPADERIDPTNREPTDAAYILFTSGSSGTPKGVEVSHANVCNFFVGVDRLQEPEHEICWLAGTNVTFDISVFELQWPLCRGHKYVLNSSRELSSNFAETISKNNVTHFQCTPAQMQLLISDPTNWNAMAKLKRVFVGGDVMSQALADKLLSLVDAKIFNMYGPTETTIWSSAWRVTNDKSVRVGKPLANQQMFVLDDCLQSVPIGITGQLFIGGEGVSIGYFGDLLATAEAFINHPEFGRLYRTGDLVRMDVDGDLEFIGRNDNQVKLLGHRFELGTIESTLLKHSDIENCVAYIEGELNEKKLVVKFVCNPNSRCSTEDFIVHLRQRLPDYMIPARLISVPSMPLNPSGKIDRAAVIAMNSTPENQTSGYDQTKNPWRDQQFNQLIEIIRDQLQIEELPLDGVWTDLEISSLDVVGLVVKIERDLELPVPVSDLFRKTSINDTLQSIVGGKTPTAAHHMIAEASNNFPDEIEEGVI